MNKRKLHNGPTMFAHSYLYTFVKGRRDPDGSAVLTWKTDCRVCKKPFEVETGNPPDRDAVLCVCKGCRKSGRAVTAKGYAAQRLRWARWNWAKNNR